MSKQLSALELQYLLQEQLGEDHPATIDYLAALESFSESMTEAADAVADHLGVRITGPADCESEHFLVGFQSSHPSIAARKAFEEYDEDGSLSE